MTKFDPNSPRGVTTRDGHKVTIDCIYASGEYPIRGRIGDSACQTWWTADGHYYHVGNTTCEEDLINPPEPDPETAEHYTLYAEKGRLQDMLRRCATELENYINHYYRADKGIRFAVWAAYDHEMNLVREAKKLLEPPQ